MNQNFLLHESISHIFSGGTEVDPSTVSHQWSGLSKQLRNRGINPREAEVEVICVAIDSDGLLDEKRGMRQTLLIHIFLIISIALAMRLVLLGLGRRNDDWTTIDFTLCLMSIVIMATVTPIILKKLPKLWTLSPDENAPSSLLIHWVSIITLDDFKTHDSNEATAESMPQAGFADPFYDSLRRQWRDGVDRRLDRKAKAFSWARRQNLKNRQDLRNFRLQQSLTELLTALIIGTGLCAVPVVEFLEGGVMAENNDQTHYDYSD